MLAPLSSYFSDPGQRVYWAYLVGALLLAVAVGLSRTEARGARSLLGWLFPRSVWFHPSSFLDVKLMFAKAPIKAFVFVPVAGSSFGLALWVVARLDRYLGVPEPSALSPTTISLLYTVVLFLGWDASRFLLHSLAHRIPALWELHKVHHSAQVMTPFTLFRAHPVESFLFMLRGVLVTGVLTGVFFHLFRTEALQYEFVGVNALGFVLNLVGGNLRHSHVRLCYPRWLEHVLISPAQHQIHHSRDPSHHHRNCGAWLAVWDWLAGTLILSSEARPRAFGLPTKDLNHSPSGLLSALIRPLLGIVRRIFPIAS